jgi:phosphatidylserine/phosphatidylglycerophosphate/cardiolipin synthase-like enzyme
MTSIWYPPAHAELELEAPHADPAAVAGLLQRGLGATGRPIGAAEGAAAYAGGERDPNRLADVVFNARHPERHGRAIGRAEPALAQEWTWIRDQVVAPALRQAQSVAPVPVAPPPPVVAPAPSRFTVPADPSQLLPPPRTHVGVTPLFPGDVALQAETELIRTVATRPDGWVYFANWYAGLAVRLPDGRHMPNPALQPFTEALTAAGRVGARIRALLWDGSMHELASQIDGVTSRLRRQIASVAPALGSLSAPLQQALRDALMEYAIGKTNRDVNAETVEFLESLRLPDLAVARDDETLPVGSHHQKFLVVGNRERTVAVLGGVDLNRNRVFPVKDSPGTPYFDISVRLDGQAAADVADIFERRWRAYQSRRNSEPRRNGGPPRNMELATTRRHTAPEPPSGGATVQVGVNFGCRHPHADIDHAIRGADRLIRNVLSNCRRFFYAEDQYGVGNSELEDAINRAFANGARFGVVVLADAWGVDDLPEIEYRRHQFWSRFVQVRTGQLLVFQRRGDDGTRTGPHAYVHSKLVIVDDLAATIGSVNMNRRSWYYDSEIAATITDSPETIRALRVGIWRQHLKPRGGDVSERELLDPLAALRLWQEAYVKSAPWYDYEAESSPRPRLGAITFGQVPERYSERIISSVRAKVAGAIPLVGAGAGWAAGQALGLAKGLLDNAVDVAFDNLFDPTGPPTC